jgi:hypothetical protein
MESRDNRRRFPAPWSVEQEQGAYRVRDANGVLLAIVPYEQACPEATPLRPDEARRIAIGIARIPEERGIRPDFKPRGAGHNWRPSHPYHVALSDSFVAENYDGITALCARDGLPLKPTGEVLDRGVRWRVYEFRRQIDAIRFWAAFNGQWLLGDSFLYIERPRGLPLLDALERLYGKKPIR